MDFDNFYSRTKTYFKKDFIKFKDLKIGIIGLGGIGSFTTEFLARFGFNLVLVDFDKVTITNLARQNYNLNDLDKQKSIALSEKLVKINPNIDIEIYDEYFSINNARDIVEKCDYVIDALDEMKPRFILNEMCKILQKDFIHVGAIQRKGNIAYISKNGPCLNCLYPNIRFENDKCDKLGVSPMTPTIMGLIASELLINVVLKKAEPEILYRFDFEKFKFDKLKFKHNLNCSVCKNEFKYFKKD